MFLMLARVWGAKLAKLDKDEEALPACKTEVSLWKAASNHNTSLTQCRARVKSPGNGSICKIQQVTDQNQPARGMMVAAENNFTCRQFAWFVDSGQFESVNTIRCMLELRNSHSGNRVRLFRFAGFFFFPSFLGVADCAVTNKVKCDETNRKTQTFKQKRHFKACTTVP